MAILWERYFSKKKKNRCAHTHIHIHARITSVDERSWSATATWLTSVSSRSLNPPTTNANQARTRPRYVSNGNPHAIVKRIPSSFASESAGTLWEISTSANPYSLSVDHCFYNVTRIPGSRGRDVFLSEIRISKEKRFGGYI